MSDKFSYVTKRQLGEASRQAERLCGGILAANARHGTEQEHTTLDELVIVRGLVTARQMSATLFGFEDILDEFPESADADTVTLTWTESSYPRAMATAYTLEEQPADLPFIPTPEQYFGGVPILSRPLKYLVCLAIAGHISPGAHFPNNK